jgi:hypothetical protein
MERYKSVINYSKPAGRRRVRSNEKLLLHSGSRAIEGICLPLIRNSNWGVTMFPTVLRSHRLALFKLRCGDAARISTQRKASFAASASRRYTSSHETKEPSHSVSDGIPLENEVSPLGSKAFVDCDREAIVDLFRKYAVDCDVSGRYMDKERLADLLRAVGENPNQETIDRLFAVADENGDGAIELDVRRQKS